MSLYWEFAPDDCMKWYEVILRFVSHILSYFSCSLFLILMYSFVVLMYLPNAAWLLCLQCFLQCISTTAWLLTPVKPVIILFDSLALSYGLYIIICMDLVTYFLVRSIIIRLPALCFIQFFLSHVELLPDIYISTGSVAVFSSLL